MVHEVKDLDEFQKILNEAGDKLVVVDFTAEWCGPCQMMAPIFCEMSQEPVNANVIFLKVDATDGRDVKSFYNVTRMPAFHFYKNNQKVYEFTGADEAQLHQKVRELR
ncbi:thioredoxin [Maylandia zebra]|uniref:Thioredoxin n=2 Tax=Haplochromini TaxID=319058 RepID=A0A3P9D1T9_9CICH|nr:thioredoxin [Maylandia zebra]XP_026018116.1 thioredoxin-like [Astatotilapia calliptera]